MKLPISCVLCAADGGTSTKLNSVHLRNDGIYSIMCPNGHNSKLVLQNSKYEILFESGIYALQDGYLREAVSSFVAGYERFLEFYVSLRDFEHPPTDGGFDALWKLIGNQSERQLGAFLHCFLQHEHSVPNFDFQGFSTFRNKVIHKGYIPIRQEVLQFGEQVKLLEKICLGSIIENNRDLLIRHNTRRMLNLHKTIDGGVKTGTLALPTFLGYMSYRRKETLEQYAEGLRVLSLLS